MKRKQKFIYWENIPEYDGKTGKWGNISFTSKQDFNDFLRSIFIEDGPETGYQFDETSKVFNEEGRKWLDIGVYCNYTDLSRDFKTYWNTQKERCRKGIIVRGKNGRTWYLTRDYYMWLNFLPIFHKEKKEFLFPDIYDGQYHIALSEKLAEVEGFHFVLLKKRQYAQSYYHMAKLINQIWFENGVTLKLLAYLDEYINDKGSWSFINEYRDFLNQHTAWYRPFDPDKTGLWQQRIKVTENGRDTYKGRKGRLLGITTKQSSTKGVGGGATYIMCEESGINPTLDDTYGYGKSALEDGPGSISGQFIAYGSVGDLKECEPLKKFVIKPRSYGMFSVMTRLKNSKETLEETGSFIPENWNLKGFMDQHGNSDAKGAKNYILEYRKKLESELTPAEYQLEISQHPLYIDEAFDVREVAVFPIGIMKKQIERIESGYYPEEWVELEENEKKEIIISKSKNHPITKYPIDPKMTNKEGVIQMFERPDKNPTWGTYFASVDPVAQGSTDNSDSLCSIIVYKAPTEVIIKKDDGTISSVITGDKIVCSWCGRFDDINKTHKRLELIIRVYNAWAIVENNISLFIQHMIMNNLQHHLVPKNQVLFLKELSGITSDTDYGWRNAGTIFKDNLIPYGIKFMTEEIDVIDIDDKGGKEIIYGVTRIPDKMIFIEAINYRHKTPTQKKINTDRLISYCSLVAFAQIQLSNFGYNKRLEYTEKFEKQQKNTKFILTPFANLNNKLSRATRRSPFNHLR